MAKITRYALWTKIILTPSFTLVSLEHMLFKIEKTYNFSLNLVFML